jgi:hypothetical protein
VGSFPVEIFFDAPIADEFVLLGRFSYFTSPAMAHRDFIVIVGHVFGTICHPLVRV